MRDGKGVRNVPASVRARLLNLSRSRGVEFQRLLSEFAIERLLYRLGASRYSDRFVLKGATLFKLWSGHRYRATWDLDLLGWGAEDRRKVAEQILEICAMEQEEDGLVFDTSSFTAEPIRDEEAPLGTRLRFEAELDTARFPVQVDIGFDRSVTPPPRRAEFPTLLDHPAPEILVYAKETVIAEKLEAMVKRGVTNSRMKDFFDLYVLSYTSEFDGPTLADAIQRTFQQHGVPLPQEKPVALSERFLTAPRPQAAWRAFLRRSRLDATPDMRELAETLSSFLWPPLEALSTRKAPPVHWPPGGPWESHS